MNIKKNLDKSKNVVIFKLLEIYCLIKKINWMNNLQIDIKNNIYWFNLYMKKIKNEKMTFIKI